MSVDLVMQEKENGQRRPSEPEATLLQTSDSNKNNSEDALFDGLMEAVGNNGRFQNKLNLIFNCVFVILMTMPYLNVIMIMSVPQHFCHVPGRDKANISLAEWQQKMLPKFYNPRTETEELSSCKMYLNGNETGSCFLGAGCTSGFDYDTTWYSSTAPSDNDWVCDRELYVTNVFVVSRVGEIIGIFILGQLGDFIGRKPVFYVGLVMLVTGRSLLIVTSHAYTWFLAAVVLGSLANVSFLQTPLVIAMEVSSEKRRVYIAFIQSVSWMVGSGCLPLIQWAVSDWKNLILITTLPSCAAFFTHRLMPESPRWLASRGKVKEAGEVLKYIAAVNGNQVPDNMYQVLEKIKTKKEKTYGIASLFSSFRLGKNTILVIICCGVVDLSFSTLYLNVSKMDGNPFLNFFWQALAELPGYIIGRYLSNNYGRRWIHAGCYVIIAGMYVLIMLTHGGAAWWTTSLVTGVKFVFCIAYSVALLQAVEIYPTCLRQTGTSIGSLVANVFSVLGPFIVYLGTIMDARLPYVALFGLAILASVCAIFLPETHNMKLPETLDDARSFGEEQKFWSLNKSNRMPS